MGIKSRGYKTDMSNRPKIFSEIAALKASRKTSGVKFSFSIYTVEGSLFSSLKNGALFVLAWMTC